MVVYLDILFLLNLFVNYFLIIAAAKLNGIKPKFLRSFAGAAFGALFSLFIFLPNIHFLLNIAVKLLASSLIILIVFGFKTLKGFLKVSGTFFAVSFIFAGFMLALWFSLKPSGMAVNNGIVYFNISPLILIISTLLCYLLITMIRRIFRVNAVKNDTYQIEIGFGKQVVEMTALMDTGHTLVDILSGAPVIVAEYSAIEPLLPVISRPSFTNVAYEPPEILRDRYRLIPYSVIGGAGLLPAFRPDYVQVKIKGKNKNIKNALVAVSRQSLSHRFEALFGSELLNQGEVLHEIANIKK